MSILTTSPLFWGKFDPLGITSIKNNRTLKFFNTAELPAGLAITLVGGNWVRDICLYWNFHMGSNLTGIKSQQILLPYEIFKHRNQVNKLINLLRSAKWCPAQITLYSDSVDNKKKQRLKDRLYALFNGEKTIYVSSFNYIANFSISHSINGESTLVEEDKLIFRVPPLQFDKYLNWGEWVVDIKQQNPYEFPLSSKLNYFLCGSPTEQWIQLRDGYWFRCGEYQVISARVNKKTNFTTLHKVKPFSAFEARLSDSGYSIHLNDIHNFTEAFVSMLGDLSIIENMHVRELIWLLRNRKAYTYDDLLEKLHCNGNDQIIEYLVDKKILFRGVELICDYCGTKRWYPLNQVDEIMQCAGCLRKVRLPTAPNFKYVLNELVYKVVCGGAIPVILTKRVLDKLSFGEKLSAFGLGITKGDIRTDIDLITTYNGHTVLCECKEYKNGIPAKEKGKAADQIKQLIEVALEVEAHVVIFSSFLPIIHQDFQNISRTLFRLNKKHEKDQIAIHLLSLTELKFIHLMDMNKSMDNVDLLNKPI